MNKVSVPHYQMSLYDSKGPYRPGEVVEVGRHRSTVVAPISPGFSTNHLAYVHASSTHDGTPPRAAVLKRFLSHDAKQIAQEAYGIFQQFRERLLGAGAPDILECTFSHQLTERAYGVNLEEFVRLQGRLTFEQVHAIVLATAAQIRKCMEIGVSHNDVKATNIMFATPCAFEPKPWVPTAVKLIDYDCMGEIGAYHPGPVGSLLYLAPERLTDDKTSRSSDLFSLGILALELLCHAQGSVSFEHHINDDVKTQGQAIAHRMRGLIFRPNALNFLEAQIRQDYERRARPKVPTIQAIEEQQRREFQCFLAAIQVIRFAKAYTAAEPKDRPQDPADAETILTNTDTSFTETDVRFW